MSEDKFLQDHNFLWFKNTFPTPLAVRFSPLSAQTLPTELQGVMGGGGGVQLYAHVRPAGRRTFPGCRQAPTRPLPPPPPPTLPNCLSSNPHSLIIISYLVTNKPITATIIGTKNYSPNIDFLYPAPERHLTLNILLGKAMLDDDARECRLLMGAPPQTVGWTEYGYKRYVQNRTHF